MKITFHGAARTTTDSMHLPEAGGKRIRLDCGLFQGRRLVEHADPVEIFGEKREVKARIQTINDHPGS